MSLIKPNPFVGDLVPYVPGKPLEELEREIGIKDAVKIASNENPLGPSPLAEKAVKEAIHSLNRYPDGDAFYLKKKLSSKLGISAETLIFGNGSNDVIDIATRTFMEPGDEAIFGEYAFIVYPIVVQAVGAKGVISPMPNYTHDLRDMYSRITEKTKIIFIANPNNPTGTMIKRAEFEWFLEKVPEDILVLMDEAYFEYVEDKDYPNSLEYQNSGKSILTVRTFSKIYGLAGLRLGYGIAAQEIISNMQRVRQPFNANSLSQVGAMAALDDTGHIEKTKNVNREGLMYVTEELEKLDISYAPSYTNFVLIDVGDNPIPVYNSLLKEGVIVRPVMGYGLKTHLRVTIGLPEENEKFIRGIKKVLGK
ncbi:MAG: histidinol-phosphate transaminase [Candidatus Dadabacteria bacterium]|nr:MAG: histidinol-phosphate transaminase [Candidatus Dadabacteria bacterium]TDJ03022.1 MAG: histidinol-phosphate transaminase [Candidatus Dadabacteria bacterium]